MGNDSFYGAASSGHKRSCTFPDLCFGLFFQPLGNEQHCHTGELKKLEKHCLFLIRDIKDSPKETG